MKKIAFLLALLLAAGVLGGCAPAGGPAGGERLRIVAALFPEYDWVRQVLGDRAGQVELTLLLDESVDLHSFQPTADDMVAIAHCDLFLYTGGESAGWVEEALANAAAPNRVALDLLEALGDGVKAEEPIEGMQASEHPHEEEERDHAHHGDEHIWLSLKHAATLCGAIADVLGDLDPDHREEYAENAAAYLQKLTDLDGRYRAAVEAAATRTLLFADRFPFRYLADDYGLTCYAAFAGCSAETEASFETVAFLAGKVDELALPCVLTIEGTAHHIARTVVENTRTKDQAILTLDSMQSVTAGDVAAGASYLAIMERNLETLKTALG